MKFKKSISAVCLIALTVFSFVACGSGSTKKPDLKDIHDAVVAAYGENYIPSVPMDKEVLVTATGVKAEDIEEFIAQTPTIDLSTDTFVAIKAVEGKGLDVETELIKYQVFVANESFQYPMNQAKAKASKVIRQGDYVFFIMLGASNPAENSTEEEALTFAKEQIKIGNDAIAAMFK